MFVVYNPEGSVIAAMAQHLPQQKVDPASRINPVQNSELSGLNVDAGKLPQAKQHALKAYQGQSRDWKHGVVVSVAEIMRSPVYTIDVQQDMEQAYELMYQHHISHLPVLMEGRLVGLLNKEQVLSKLILNERAQVEQAVHATAMEMMTAQVVTVQPQLDIRHIAEAMVLSGLSAMVVLNPSEQILGIVTQNDLVRRLAQNPPIEVYI